jgi:glycosyltransferase involved in cell wall biosynthesis
MRNPARATRRNNVAAHGQGLKILASPYRETSHGNPVQAMLYDALERNGALVTGFSRRKLLFESWDVWHLHWPFEYVANTPNAFSVLRNMLMFSIALNVASIKKTKVFWTVHNIRPHERRHWFLEWLFWRLFLPNLRGIICMSHEGRRELFRRHPRTRSVPVHTIPHGHYRGAYPDVMCKREARAALDICPDKFVAVYIGQIRPYKGLVRLIGCFVDAEIADAELLIAGAADARMAREIQDAAASARNVKLALGFVERHDMQKYLRAADLVVLPYIEILNSGSAILALSFDRPILVPARGALAELRDLVGPDWVALYEGSLTEEIVRNAVQWTKARPVSCDARAPLDALDWDRIARLTIQAFS